MALKSHSLASRAIQSHHVASAARPCDGPGPLRSAAPLLAHPGRRPSQAPRGRSLSCRALEKEPELEVMLGDFGAAALNEWAGSGPGEKVATPTSLREALSGSDLEALDAAMEKVESLGFSEEDAQTILERSFGWFRPSQSFWRGEVVEVVPSESQISTVIDYLAELGIKGADLKKYVDSFPHVFGCDVEQLLRANVTELEKTWKIKGPTLTATLKRRPEILGYNLDCLGDCKGECNRCWVRF